MDSSKKLLFPDQFFSARRRNILSRFGLGIAASLVIVTLLSLANSSFNVPFVSPLLQGLRNSNLNIPSSGPSSSSSNQVEEKKPEVVPVPDVKASSFESGQTRDTGSKNTSLSGEGEVSSFESGPRSGDTVINSTLSEDGKVSGRNDENTLEANATISVGNSSSLVSDLGGRFVPANSSNEKNATVEADRSRGSYEDCDIYDGNWVRADDETMPYYPPGSCPYIDRDFNCHANKRPDDGYVKWKWQPNGCDIPR